MLGALTQEVSFLFGDLLGSHQSGIGQLREQRLRPSGKFAQLGGDRSQRLTLRWLRGQLPTRYDWVRGIPILDSRVRESTRRRREEQRKGRFESAYCAETVAVTYEEMGLIQTEKRSNWFDPGRFWSGDGLPLIAPYRLGSEIAVVAD